MVAGRALLAGASVSLIGCLLLTTLVMGQHLGGADSLARTLVRQWDHRLLRPVMEKASFLGGHPGQITVVVLGVAVLWRRRRRWALSLPIVMAGSGLVQLLGKWAVDHPRPNLEPSGFPSAHVLTLVVLFGYITYVAGTSRVRRGGWRSLVVGLCVATVGTVAYSRLYLDAHWLSDVLGGVTGGLAYLLVAVWVIRSIPRRWGAPVLRAASLGARMAKLAR